MEFGVKFRFFGNSNGGLLILKRKSRKSNKRKGYINKGENKIHIIRETFISRYKNVQTKQNSDFSLCFRQLHSTVGQVVGELEPWQPVT